MAATTSPPLAAMRRPAVPTAASARTPCRLASSAMPAIASEVRCSALSTIAALRHEPFAQARHLRAVGDGPPPTAGIAFGDVELDRIGAGVDHRIALRHVIEQRRQATRIGDVGIAAQAEFAHRGDHRGGILRLHGQRARGLAVGHHVRQLGHAATDGVARASLVDLHHAHSPARRGEPGQQLLLREPARARRRGRQSERLEDLRRVGGGQRKAGLHDRRPLLEAVGVDLAQHLDVHQCIADLHVAARPATADRSRRFPERHWV